jgi:cytochrome c oxidase subunit 2
MRRSSTDIRHFIIVGVLVVVVAIGLYLALLAALPLPLQASSQSLDIDWLFQAHMMLLSLLFALIVVFMVYAFVVFRRREGDDGDGEHFEGNTTLEITWTVLPLVAVVIFGYLGVQSLRYVTAEQPDEMAIRAEAFQWAWAFSYPETGVQSAELVLPVDQAVVMQMTSRDVIHAFWVPEFRVKKDLVPGQTTELRITPIEEGEYDLVCAEICGLTHYNMIAPVRVVSQDEFALWMNEQVVEQGLELASKQPATN